jgi:hypothetical protein
MRFPLLPLLLVAPACERRAPEPPCAPLEVTLDGARLSVGEKAFGYSDEGDWEITLVADAQATCDSHDGDHVDIAGISGAGGLSWSLSSPLSAGIAIDIPIGTCKKLGTCPEVSFHLLDKPGRVGTPMLACVSARALAAVGTGSDAPMQPLVVKGLVRAVYCGPKR